MHRRSTSILAFSLFSAVTVLACNDDKPPTPIEVRERIASDLGNVLHEANAAISGGTTAIPGAAALAVVDRVLGSDPQIGPAVRTVSERFAARASAAPDEASDAIDTDALIARLNDKLFTDENHIGDGIYEVPASLVCATTTVDSTGHSIEAIDGECAERRATAELRVRTAKDGGALVFAIQVDADHDEPLIISLTHTSIAITVDLDDAQRAFVALAGLYGEDVPNARLSGQVTAKLEILGAAKLRASLTIDRALAIAFAKVGASLDGPDSFVVSSAKAEVIAVTLDGKARSGSFALGLGETAIKAPADGKRVELDLAGATATAAFVDGQPLELKHVGLGNRTTTLSVNGVRAVAIDLNAQDGRAFDATVSHDAGSGTDTLEVTPKLDLQVTVDREVLGGTPPVYDVTRVLLDGSLRGSDAGDQVEVLTGSFSVTTDPANYGFAATAGQCVTAADATDPTTGSMFTRFSVAACP
jgi:hypothetical protein